MNTRTLLIGLVVGIMAASFAGGAEKEKRTSVSDFPFWSSKKRGDVAQFIPGLTAALQLTEDQKRQIAAAREEMMGDPGVVAARGSSKSDPKVTAEQRDKGKAAIEAAMTLMRGKVSTILSTEQKALIGKVNDAYAAAVDEIGIVYSEKFASVKADEAARKRLQEDKNEDTEELFRHKLDALLSAPQKDAMTRAAADEEARNAKAAAVKKPVK